MVSTTTLLATIALAASTTSAFTAPPISAGANPRCAAALRATDPTQALSDYMIKSHDDKLRAVRAAEAGKNSEIEALREEIRQLRAAPSAAAPSAPPAAPPAAPAAPASDMEAKLVSYQSFMAEYIVNAQTQKFLAVKEAEAKAERKFQDRLEKLLGAAAAGPASEAPAAAAVAEPTSFQSRNARIIAAGAAGKSRWGSREIERAKIESAAAAPSAAAPSAAAPATAFESRSAQVVAAGSGGRWGAKEVERAKGGVGSPPAATAAPPAAAAVSLGDRVNLGARLLGQ